MSPKKKNKRKPAAAPQISREAQSKQTQKQDAVKLIAILIILGLVMTLFVGALLTSPAKAAESATATPSAPATGQIYDTDKDGQENNIDPDIDGDGVVNGNDSDMDGDGIANNKDGDPAATLGVNDGPPPVTLQTPTVLDTALPVEVRFPAAIVAAIAALVWLAVRRRRNK